MKKQIPNLFTLGNLACGVLAILAIFHDALQTATLLVLLAAVLDFFDGFLARLLKVSGELGKQLDSLADMVTFGVAPGFMLYALAGDIGYIDDYRRYAFLLLPLLSCYRLAKFNIDTRQTTSFIGVNTPVTGIMCMSWAFVDPKYSELIFFYPWGFVLFCLVVSCLLISELKLPSLKLKKAPLKTYAKHIVLLLIGLVTLVFYGWLCVPVFYVAYVLSAFSSVFEPRAAK